MRPKIVNGEETYYLPDGLETITIGRSSRNNVVITSSDFSREHCVLFIEDATVSIIDLGSKNGVTIDGARIEPNQKTVISPWSTVCIAQRHYLHIAAFFQKDVFLEEERPRPYASLSFRRRYTEVVEKPKGLSGSAKFALLILIILLILAYHQNFVAIK